MSFPSSTDSFAGFTSSHTLAADNHAAQSNAEQTAIGAIENKIGTGASTPTSGVILRGNGTGTSTWDTLHLSTDIQGVLNVSNGGTGIVSFGAGVATFLGTPSSANLAAALTDETGTGPSVFANNPTLSGGTWGSSPTLSIPQIASFANANHNHQNITGGGQLTTGALSNASVTADKLATGIQTAAVATAQTLANASYTDLATAGPAVTVTIGANGIALVILSGELTNDTSAAFTYMSFAATGANTIAAADANALFGKNSTGAPDDSASYVCCLTGLTAGSTVFTAKYRNSAGTATFTNRNITVLPL